MQYRRRGRWRSLAVPGGGRRGHRPPYHAPAPAPAAEAGRVDEGAGARWGQIRALPWQVGPGATQ